MSGRVTVPVSPERAWDYVADIRNAPAWMYGVRGVVGPPQPPLRTGDRLRIQLVAGSRLADSEWVVGSCERPHLVTSTGRAMGARAELRIECRPLGENSAEVVQKLQYDLPGGPLGLLASRFGVRGILEMQAQRSLQTLARRLGPVADAESQVFVEAGAGDLPGNH